MTGREPVRGRGYAHLVTGMPQRARDARMLRALIATLVVIGLGHTAHSLGGATGPQPLAVGVLAALVGPLVWALVRRGASATRLGVAMGAGQVLTHLTLVAMAPGRGTSTAVHVHGASGLPTSDAVTSAGATVTSTGTAVTSLLAGLHVTPGMLAAHAIATVLAAVLLSRGEDAVRAVVRALLPEPLSLRFAHGIRRLAVEAGALTTPTSRALRPVGGRGPPLPVT